MQKLEEPRKQLEYSKRSLRTAGPDVQVPSDRKKSFQRAKACMPKQSAQYVTTTMDLIDKASLRKAAIFRQKNIQTTTERRLNVAVVEAVAKGLPKSRQYATRKPLACFLNMIKNYNLRDS